MVAKFVREKVPVDIIGVDVIDINATNLPFKQYNGKQIPLANKSQDVTYAISVFHHTTNAESLLAECIRVTRKKLIIVEDVYKNGLELLITKSLDYTNILVSTDMEMPLNFRKEKEWLALFRRYKKVKDVYTRKVRPVLLRPTRHRLFEINLHTPPSNGGIQK